MPNALWISVRTKDEQVLAREIGSRPLSIGRSLENDIVLSGVSISRKHAELSPRAEGLVLIDLRTVGGTFVHGRRIDQAVLGLGDSFTIGPFELTVISPEAASEDAPEHEPLAREPASRSPATLEALTDLVGLSDQQAVLETLLERTRELTGSTAGFVLLTQGKTLSPVLASTGSAAASSRQASATVCRRALETARPVVLWGEHASSEVAAIPSLAAGSPGFVAAIPLVHEARVLGVLYLESHDPTEALARFTEWLPQISAVGGRALAVALVHGHLTSENERWKWLANAPDVADLRASAISPAMQRVVRLLERTAAEEVTVLLRGESGTGKEVAARTLHRLSAHAEGPFVGINCGALPRELLEAELFGYEKGAFTGADRSTPGRLELSQGGTLLLDEVGDLPRDLQVKLLRVLETRSFERLGGRSSIPFTGRLVTATNRDLEAAMAAGEFREDLYFRLDVVSLVLPPLRDRLADLESLVLDMLLRFNRKFRRKLIGVAEPALAAMRAYRWPGNIRELRNVIERAFILEETDFITLAAVPLKPAASSRPTAAPPLPTASPPLPHTGQSPPAAATTDDDDLLPLAHVLARAEHAHILRVLRRVGGSVTQAASVLGIARQSLQRKLKELDIRSGGA